MRGSGKTILGVIGLLLLCCGENWGADWRLLGENEWAASYYDADSITRPPSKIILRVSEKKVFTEKGVAEAAGRSGFGEKYRDLSFVVAVSELNCAEKQKRTLSLTWYSKDGKILSSDEGLSARWDPIFPGSISETLYQRLCREPQGEAEPERNNEPASSGEREHGKPDP